MTRTFVIGAGPALPDDAELDAFWARPKRPCQSSPTIIRFGPSVSMKKPPALFWSLSMRVQRSAPSVYLG